MKATAKGLIACGIDPGLDTSAFGLVTSVAGGYQTAYGPQLFAVSTGKVSTPGLDPRRWDLSPLLDALTYWRPAVVGVEIARGAVRGQVSADPILQVNVVAGALTAFLHAAGYQVAVVASGGLSSGWNWRSELGVSGRGAEERDASVRGILRARGVTLPTGPRGGLDQDTADAVGLGAAVLDRSTRRKKPGADALAVPDRAALVNLERERLARAGRKQARALKKRYGVA